MSTTLTSTIWTTGVSRQRRGYDLICLQHVLTTLQLTLSCHSQAQEVDGPVGVGEGQPSTAGVGGEAGHCSLAVIGSRPPAPPITT